MAGETNVADTNEEREDLIQQEPEDLAAGFQGFATKDGEIIPPKGESAAPKTAKVAVKPAAKTPGDAAGDPEGDGAPDPDQERHKSAQTRINKAVGKQRAAERESARLRDENTRLSARLDAIEARLNGESAGKKPKSDPNAPQPDDYENGELDMQYIRDSARYEARKEFEAQNRKSTETQKSQEQAAQQREMQKRLDSFVQSGLGKYDDFDEVVLDDGLNISQTLGELFLESEHGPDIAYAMASDPNEAKRVSAMTPSRQAAWFGQKEAELSSESSDAGDPPPEGGARTPKTTQAPPIPKAKARGNGASQATSAATSDFAAFERMAMNPK